MGEDINRLDAAAAAPPARPTVAGALRTMAAVLKARPWQVLALVAAYEVATFLLFAPPGSPRRFGVTLWDAVGWLTGAGLRWGYLTLLAYQVIAWADGRRSPAEAGKAALRALPLILVFALLFVAPGVALRAWQQSHVTDLPIVEIAKVMVIGGLGITLLLQVLFGVLVFVLPTSLDRRIGPWAALGAGMGLARRHGWWLARVLAVFWFIQLGFELALTVVMIIGPMVDVASVKRSLLITDWIRLVVSAVALPAVGLFWAAVYLSVRPSKRAEAPA